MTPADLQSRVLATLAEGGGRVRPADLVSGVATQAKVPPVEVRQALRRLLDRRMVDLNWQGEFEASPNHP